MRSKTPKQPVRRSSRTPRSSSEEIISTSNRKRKAPNSSVQEQPKIKKKAPDGRKIDMYCWICHKIGQEKICKTCPRVYHTKCIKNLKFNDSGSCEECQAKSVSKHDNIPRIKQHHLKELLKFALKEALKEKSSGKNQHQMREDLKFCKFFKSWPNPSDDKLCQVIDIEYLIDKVNDSPPSYSNTAEFFSDIKWICHNCYISYGSESEITEAALRLEKNFKLELTDIEACPECYEIKHSDDSPLFFTRVCSNPHQIVWAKMKGSPYWPAKCLRIFKGSADLRFFGSHDRANLQLSHCYKISHRSPNEREIRQSKYLDSLHELAVYINNYKRKFSTFPYAPARTPLDPTTKTSKKTKRGRRKRSSLELPESNELPPGEIVYTKLEIPQVNSETDSSFSTLECSENMLLQEQEHNSTPVICMTFSTDDETSVNDSSSQYQTISSSESINKTQENAEHFADPVFKTVKSVRCPTVLQTCTHLTKDGSEDFVNTETSSRMPVITSAVSECENSSETHFQQAICIMPPKEESEKNQSSKNISRNYNKEITNESISALINEGNISPTSDQEDDLQIIKEIKGNARTVNMLSQNSQLAEALCEVIIQNRPYLKDFYKMCQSFGRRSFLQLWLTTRIKQNDPGEVATFCAVYKQIAEKNDQLKSQLKKSEEENAKIKEELKKSKEETLNLIALNRIMKENMNERAMNTTILLDALRKKYEYFSLQESKVLAEEEVNKLKKRIEVQEELNAKQAKEIEEWKNKFSDLQSKLSELENSKSNNSEREIQTDISQHPGRKLYTEKDLKEILAKDSKLRITSQEDMQFLSNNLDESEILELQEELIFNQEETHTVFQSAMNEFSAATSVQTFPHPIPGTFTNSIISQLPSSIGLVPIPSIPQGILGPIPDSTQVAVSDIEEKPIVNSVSSKAAVRKATLNKPKKKKT